ncbi:MAG: replication-associated recombination protein A [Candidatus Aminicenantes bacterium]
MNSDKQDRPDQTPLAEKMRPRTLGEFRGQNHLIGKGKILSRLLESKKLVSLIFWGPPGSGKTTLGYILAGRFDFPFQFFSAVLSSVKEIKSVMERAEKHKKLYVQPTIIFIDEIHRFNKAQQAAFLPYVERGDVLLFGSTTENPSFEVIAPLLSRTRVLELKALDDDTLESIIQEALKDEVRGLGAREKNIFPEAADAVIQYANGDARRALNTLEIAADLTRTEQISLEDVREALQRRVLLYDKKGEEHFNLISALHKSLRNSDVDAALYWLGRMIHAGEDRLYIARRMVRFAVEDIGLADPKALRVAMDAKEAYEFLGTPEGELALVQAAAYLASAPKSNRIYSAYLTVMKDVEEAPFEPVPLQIRNAPTKLMKDIGYGREYRYAHHFAEATSDMETVPERLRGRKYYRPGPYGVEKEIKKRMDWWAEQKEKLRKSKLKK